MPSDRAELLASLEKHNAAFTTLLSFIPSQYYIAPTQEEVSLGTCPIPGPDIAFCCEDQLLGSSC
jgi:hypothetical protein